MSINTNQYLASHSKRPRGTGNWFFEIVYQTNRRELFQYNAIYSAALQQARKYGRSQGSVWQIIVLP